MPLPTLRWLSFLTASLLALVSSVRGQSAGASLDELFANLRSTGTARVTALEAVIRRAEEMPTPFLFIASGVAMQERRLEDAAFLFYAAQIRTRFDAELFPPTGTGGNSPLLALAVLRQGTGSVINPAIVLEPKVYAAALERFRQWQPRAPTGYSPGWSYTSRGSEEAAIAAVAEARQDLYQVHHDMVTLLQDPDYFAAFRTAQDYNLKRGDERPSQAAFDAAVAVLKRIEAEREISGFAAQLNL